MKYEQQLFGIMSEQLKSEIKESLDHVLTGALLAPLVRLNFSQEALRPVA